MMNYSIRNDSCVDCSPLHYRSRSGLILNEGDLLCYHPTRITLAISTWMEQKKQLPPKWIDFKEGRSIPETARMKGLFSLSFVKKKERILLFSPSTKKDTREGRSIPSILPLFTHSPVPLMNKNRSTYYQCGWTQVENSSWWTEESPVLNHNQ